MAYDEIRKKVFMVVTGYISVKYSVTETITGMHKN